MINDGLCMMNKKILLSLNHIKQNIIKNTPKYLNRIKKYEIIIEKIHEDLNMCNNPNELIKLKMEEIKSQNIIKKINNILKSDKVGDYLNNTRYIFHLWNISNETQKRKLFDEYLFITDINKYLKQFNSVSRRCINCENESITYIDKGLYSCSNCEYITKYLYEYSKYNMIEMSHENKKNNNYQKSEYYKSYMDKLQIRKIPEINKNIMKAIRDKANELKYTESTITPKKVRKILKLLGHSKLYNHVSYILHKLYGKIPPFINVDHREFMTNMFNSIESVWPEIRSSRNSRSGRGSGSGRGRSSFINYPYCIYKIIELFGEYDEYLKYFKLSSSTRNIEILDKYWAKICKKLNWEFIPTYI